jgi:quercetin dioxygenase-like cupin family protein
LTDPLSFGPIRAPVFVRKDARGTFEELLNTGRWESLIMGRMNKGAVMGNHYHRHTVLFFHLMEGSARITTIDMETKARAEYSLKAGEGFIFRPSEARAITYLADSRFLILKSHRFDPSSPDLIDYRVE